MVLSKAVVLKLFICLDVENAGHSGSVFYQFCTLIKVELTAVLKKMYLDALVNLCLSLMRKWF